MKEFCRLRIVFISMTFMLFSLSIFAKVSFDVKSPQLQFAATEINAAFKARNEKTNFALIVDEASGRL